MFRVVGGLTDRGTNELRELLVRFSVPFRFVAGGQPAGRRVLRDKDLDPARLPVMIRHDGHTMVQPAAAGIVEAVGGPPTRVSASVTSPSPGPGGLAAVVHAASEDLRTVVLQETVCGGQAGSSPMIRNYPGFARGISGHDLTRRACEQAWIPGAHMVFSQPVAGMSCRGRGRQRDRGGNGDLPERVPGGGGP